MCRRIALALLLTAGIALASSTARADPDPRRLVTQALTRLVQAAEAEGRVEIHDDAGTAAANAVVNMQGCTGTLIAPQVVLTVGHCAPDGGQFSGETPADCAALPYQAQLARNAARPTDEWLTVKPDANGWRPEIRIGLDNRAWSFTSRAAAVALPHCADLALVRLDRPVPGYRARPMPVMVTPPLNPDRVLGTRPLRHAGWGKPKALWETETRRQTGPARYWAATACHLFALPPLKPGGQRIISGDSGSPLILRQGEEDILIGVLFGSGVPDASTCRLPNPFPPQLHGTYTPTFRPRVPGSGSTDIGAWLRRMVPEADLR